MAIANSTKVYQSYYPKTSQKRIEKRIEKNWFSIFNDRDRMQKLKQYNNTYNEQKQKFNWIFQ